MTKKEDGGKQPASAGEHDNALAARRARLRSSLAKEQLPIDPYSQDSSTSSQASPTPQTPSTKNQIKNKNINSNSLPVNINNDKSEIDSQLILSRAIGALGNAGSARIGQDPAHMQEIALLNNIDQALGSCAIHLASLQKVADNQIDELKVIAQTLQMPPSSGAGRSLDTLMESLTAAIEPMKVMGELVPVLDRLVSATQAKDHSLDAAIEPIKAIGALIPLLERFVNRTQTNEQFIEKSLISNEQLTISLAQQLAAGSIDPKTFKSAYRAIFQDNDDTLLVHRLGELLAGQHISAESFQAAYNALQSGPADVIANINDTNIPVIETNVSQSNLSGVDELDRLAREEELYKQLAAKEEELYGVRSQLDVQWKELAAECDELRSALQNRQDILKEKELELNKKLAELAAKDSENQQLRAQMEQLRDETKAMMTDLQKQLSKKQQEDNALSSSKVANQPQIQQDSQVNNPVGTPASSPSGFFDFVGVSNQPNDLFSSMSKTPQLFSQEEQSSDSQADTANFPVVNPAINNVWAEAEDSKATGDFGVVKNAPAPRIPNKEAQTNTGSSASFVSAVGSYGSGVRAQVFEVIVRQALAGTQWREICAVPMQSNNISPDEVEAEVKRRQALLKK